MFKEKDDENRQRKRALPKTGHDSEREKWTEDLAHFPPKPAGDLTPTLQVIRITVQYNDQGLGVILPILCWGCALLQ